MVSRVLRVLIAVFTITFAISITAPAYAKPNPTTIVDVVIAANEQGPFAGQFDTLIAAVLAADPVVLRTLSSRGQNTVFGPTDAAFASAFAELGLPADIKPSDLPRDLLTTILLYHVAPGRRDSGQVLASTRINTRQGGFLRQSNGVLTDNLGRTATIIAVDIKADNGIIHVIDNVVLPALP
jgi:uncharacterized surface protein with fasciclin (FAS1) repeats